MPLGEVLLLMIGGQAREAQLAYWLPTALLVRRQYKFARLQSLLRGAG